MELATTSAIGTIFIYLIETICPVNTHQTNHRQENTNTYTSRTFHVERVEVLRVIPRITSLSKGNAVDGGVTQQERIANLEGQTVVSISIGTTATTLARCCIGERSVFVTTKSDGLLSITGGIATHTVTTHIEGLERRFLIFIVRAKNTEFHTCYQHKALGSIGERGIGLALELPLMIFNPAVLVLHLLGVVSSLVVCSQMLIVLLVKCRPWRC